MSPGPQSLLVGTHSPYSTTSSHSSHITVQGFTSANVSGHFRPPFLAGTFTARVNTCQPLRSPKFSVGDCTSAAQLALHSPCASHPDTRQCCGHSGNPSHLLVNSSFPQHFPSLASTLSSERVHKGTAFSPQVRLHPVLFQSSHSQSWGHS